MIKVNGAVLLEMAKSMSAIAEEHRIQINEDHIAILTVDQTNCAMIETYLNREECEYWSVIPREIAVCPKPIAEFLKQHKKEYVSVSVDSNQIVFQTESGISMTFSLLDVNKVRRSPLSPTLNPNPTSWTTFSFSVKEIKDILKSVGDRKGDRVRFVTLDDGSLRVEGVDNTFCINNRCSGCMKNRCMFGVGLLKMCLKGLENKDRLDFTYSYDKPMIITVNGIKFSCQFLVAPRVEA